MIELTIGRDGIAEVRFDAPGEKVNLLNEEALARLDEVLGRLETGCRDRSIRAVVVVRNEIPRSPWRANARSIAAMICASAASLFVTNRTRGNPV